MNKRKYFGCLALSFSIMANLTDSANASAVFRSATGANPAAIQATVDQFRADLGGANNGVGGLFKTGRREINWDGVPDSASAPNLFPANFFNVNSPRGVVFTSIPNGGSGQTALANFFVSASAASGTPVRFGNINATYSTIFQTFSSQRLFTADRTNLTEITFFVPGTKVPATVSGFGAVFCDVDNLGGPNGTLVTVFKTDGTSLTFSAADFNNGLSFAGVSFDQGERISRVIISTGNAQLDAANTDGVGGIDVVAMDDFIYGEPRATDYHRGDFDGDGQSDPVVFRPSSGTWFITNSGSGTTDIAQFGQNGDIPVEGDFDGDKLADLAVFRPSEGGWYIRRSSNGTFITQAFGAPGDKPVAGDYDKDGITDIAIWRPSNGNYFVLRSSTGLSTFFAFPFGTNGDIPLLAGPQ
jgi:hypothetical protein